MTPALMGDAARIVALVEVLADLHSGARPPKFSSLAAKIFGWSPERTLRAVDQAVRTGQAGVAARRIWDDPNSDPSPGGSR